MARTAYVFQPEPDPFREGEARDARISDVREIVAETGADAVAWARGDRDTDPVLAPLEEQSMRAEWRAYHDDLFMRTLRLQRLASYVSDPRARQALEPIHAGAVDVAYALYALCLETVEYVPDMPLLTPTVYEAAREVYAWLGRVIEHLSDVLEADTGDFEELSLGLRPVVAYSRLIVRWLLEPLITRSSAAHAEDWDGSVVRRLEALRSTVIGLDARLLAFDVRDRYR